MKRYRLLIRNFLGVLLFLPLLGGCEKALKGEEKIVGTAVINGQNYKESTVWAWNFDGYPSSLEFYKNNKLFYYIARLSPENRDYPSYSINFYISTGDFQFEINHPYIIEFYKDENINTLYWLDIIPYLSKNASEIFSNNTAGIAYAVSSVSDRRIPLKGELILENIYPQTGVCYGSYSLTSDEAISEKLVIKGRFETMTSVNEF